MNVFHLCRRISAIFVDPLPKSHTNIIQIFFISVLLLFLLAGCKHDPVIGPALPTDTTTAGTGGTTDTTGGTTGGTGANTDPCDPDSIYFQTDVLPILISNCAKSGCHDAASHKKGVILDSYENVMSTAEIDPFDLDGGKLYELITESDPDDRMPPPPNSPLSNEQVSIIAKWIMQGALNITCDANAGGCDTINVTYSGTVAPIMQTYCIGCHGGTAPSGGITLNVYEGVAAVAASGQLVGAITHSPGYTAMPFGGDMLPDCEIAQITSWVNNGAVND